MPVDRTAKTKLPSRDASRASTAFHSSGLVIMFGTVVESCNIFILPQPSLGFSNARPLPRRVGVLTCLDEEIIGPMTDPIYPKFAVKLGLLYCPGRYPI